MFKNLPQYVAYTRKAIIQVIGLVTALLALGLLPDKYNQWGAAAVAVLTTVLHFLTPNAEKPGDGEAVEAFGPDEADDEPEQDVNADPVEEKPQPEFVENAAQAPAGQ